ncbi:TonB family protein [Henriciella aquimarina]|uniref:TonB family protein n=1 Tax=Henriciella aquimarina TaxID=545261 RepID=UPI000A03720C|nr:TonB family protein [Henriciella aquimarina]
MTGVGRPSGTGRWAGAFCLVAAAHAAAGAAVVPWGGPASDPVQPLPAAIMIDLAPAPAGREAPPPEEPPKPVEAPKPKPKPKKVKPRPKPEPVVEEIEPPVVEEAEVVLPQEPEEAPVKVEPAVPEEENSPVMEPAPQVEQTRDTDAEAEAEPPQSADIDDRPPASGAAAADARAAWQAAVLGHLERHKRYPYMAQRKREEGVVYVRFVMDRSGRIISRSLEQGVSSEALNEEATALLRRAEPLPVPPVEVPGETLELVLPIQFFMRD